MIDMNKVGALVVIAAFAATGCAVGGPTATPSAPPPDATTSGPLTTAAAAVPTERASPSVPPTQASPASQALSTPVTQSTPVAISTPTTAAYPPEHLPRMTGMGSWAFADSFDEIVDRADLFVVGEVVTIAPAPIEGRLPFSMSTIVITEVLKGPLETGETVIVNQLGGVYAAAHMIDDQQGSPASLPPEAPPDEEPPLPITSIAPFYLLDPEDNPLFRVGERVALAIESSSTLPGYVLVTGPQSRFSVDEQGRVSPVAHDNPVVAPLDGITVAELSQRVAAAATN